YGFLVPEEPRLRRDVFIPPDAEGGARDGEVVVARVTDWGDPTRNPVAEVVTVLGPPGAPGVDVLSIVHGHDLPVEFPPAVLAEAEKIARRGLRAEDLEGREDLRDRLVFTIDPPDARDHDDALSVERLGRDTVRVGVHIADVSAYVAERSELDLEALKRGTSVYLVDRVVAMLPEALSGDLCSLKPDADRLALSLLLDLDSQARVLRHRFARSVIRSRHSLHYEQAHEILEGAETAPSDVRAALRTLRDLSAQLRARRSQRGSLDFDLPEARVVLNAVGEPTDIQRVLRLDTHRLIEEFMLLANMTVAEELHRRRVTAIYRVHEAPDPTKIEGLREFLRAFDLTLAKGAERSPKAFQKLLEDVRGRPEEPLVNSLVLRSMKQARYSPKAEGHFALAARHYTHFTSPIRRYPDLVVHRLVSAAILDGDRIPESWGKEILPAAADRASARERVAVEAERDSVELKKVEFMQRHLGDEFWGTISGVAAFGLFVLLDDVFVEGLVRAHTLEDDYYHFLEEEYVFAGENTGRRFRLGDRVQVRVDRVDTEARQIDLALTEHRETAPRRRPARRGRIDARPRRR
ncbi:MAG: ribonuclease R, partial [Gemmatimonadota bacterium]